MKITKSYKYDNDRQRRGAMISTSPLPYNVCVEIKVFYFHHK